MHRFWPSILHPVFLAYSPSVIVEVGSGSGENTRNLLQYCHDHDAKLIAIDPHPTHPREWEGEHESLFVFHEKCSLDVLPTLPSYEAVLIDGDHNWYTVFNELRCIENHMRGTGELPCIFLHDIEWPYGRRDLYYYPDRIPTLYRKPYQQAGLDPHHTDLLCNEGWNKNYFHASAAGGSRNGVLTAVEDFLGESRIKWKFLTITGFHGLGILIPEERLRANASLVRMIEELSPSPAIDRYLKALGTESIDAVTQAMHLDAQLRKEHDAYMRLSTEKQSLEKVLHAAEQEKQSLGKALHEERSALHHMARTRSWRWTAPARVLTGKLRAGKHENRSTRKQDNAAGALPDNCLISVIAVVPENCSAKELQSMIRSVEQQLCTYWELLLIHVSEKTQLGMHLAESYAGDRNRIREYVHDPKRYLHPLDMGIAYSQGIYLCVMGLRDALAPNALRRCAEIAHSTHPALTLARHELIDEANHLSLRAGSDVRKWLELPLGIVPPLRFVRRDILINDEKNGRQHWYLPTVPAKESLLLEEVLSTHSLHLSTPAPEPKTGLPSKD